MKPFLILQLRPEADASDGEFQAFLAKGGLPSERAHRIRLEQERLPTDLSLSDYAGVIVGGGPGCVSDAPGDKPADEARIEAEILSLMPEITERDIPFMGCCYGISILAHHLGTEVSKRRWGEPVGPVDCTVTEDGARDPLLADLPRAFPALVGHKEATQDLPPGCVHLMASETCRYQMIRCGRHVYATQFHPEADGQVFADRIRIYRDRGYFDPADADALTERCLAAEVTQPERILRKFIEIYGKT
ncbi:MAG: glutamine amidotransferase [Pseudomonadota bacterium]